MVLAALATTDDLVARLGRPLTAAETTRATSLLVDASAAVRSRVRQEITRRTSTVRLRPYGDGTRVGTRLWPTWVRLPQRPVNAVTGVVDLDGNALDFQWIGDEQLFVNATGPVTVTYDHGFDDTNDPVGVLGAVAGIICQIVGRALGRPADETALSQEAVDGYSYTVGAAASAGPFGMLDDEVAALDKLVGRTRATSMRLA